jgi:arabinose-5-phosphate isomerase
MIEPDDIVIALSNSGESAELSDIIAFCRRFGIPLIGMTGKRDSTLGNSSDIVLCLPPLREACSFGLAPTTSTTMMLALGDALAVALLEKHHFSKEQYKMRHPGGKLGRLMLLTADLMHTGDELPLVGENEQMAQALIVMTQKSLGCLGVVDGDGVLKGMITDGDLRRKMAPDLLTKKAADVMTKKPKTVEKNVYAADALRIMNTTGKGITGLFVVENGKPIGFLHLHDCLRAGVI